MKQTDAEKARQAEAAILREMQNERVMKARAQAAERAVAAKRNQR